MNWKTCSVEAGSGISKSGRLSGLSPATAAVSKAGDLVTRHQFYSSTLNVLPQSGLGLLLPLRLWDAKTRVDDVCVHLL